MAENSSKGNPASHRMSNKVLKERRASSWARGTKRAADRQAAQDEAHKNNLASLRIGEATPWQRAKAKRAWRRSQDPRVVRARRLHLADTLETRVD